MADDGDGKRVVSCSESYTGKAKLGDPVGRVCRETSQDPRLTQNCFCPKEPHKPSQVTGVRGVRAHRNKRVFAAVKKKNTTTHNIYIYIIIYI